ncbi:hypothetical protein [Actinophytocola sediminis]
MRRAVVVRWLLATSALASLLSAGCGTQRPDSTASPAALAAGEAGRRGFVEQQRILSDGVVRPEEYRAAVTGQIECLRQRKLRVPAPTLNPVDGLLLLVDPRRDGVPIEDFNAAIGECGLRHLSYVEKIYVDTHEPRMDGHVRDQAVACLRDRGIPIRGHVTSAPDLLTAAGNDAKSEVTDCIGQAATALYPDLRTLPIGLAR